MFIKIEINLSTEEDVNLLNYLSTQKKIEIIPEHHFNTKEILEVKKEMNVVSNTLATKIGTSLKMSTKERAKVAAAARWQKVRESKANGEEPKKEAPLKKKTVKKEQDFSKAEKDDYTKFPTQSAQDMILGSFEKQPFPDGREIMEGNYEVAEDEEAIEGETNEIFELEEDSEEIEEIKRIAKSYEE